MTKYKIGTSSIEECDQVIGEIWRKLQAAGLTVSKLEGPSEVWTSARFWITARHRRFAIYQEQREIELAPNSWVVIPFPSGSSNELAEFVVGQVGEEGDGAWR